MNPISLLRISSHYSDDINGYYNALRPKTGSIFWDESLNAWVIVGYKECLDLIDSKKLSKSRLALAGEMGDEDLVNFSQSVLDAQMMFSDDPKVQKRRKYWSQQIELSLGKSKNFNLESIASSTINEIQKGADFNLYEDLLRKYVSRVICYLLHVTEEERKHLYPMIVQYVGFLDGKIRTNLDLKKSLLSIVMLYSELAKKRERFEATKISKHCWVSDYILMIVAGHESTAYLLATLLLNISEIKLKDKINKGDSKILFLLIQEAIRFDSPVQIIGRKALENIIVDGENIKPEDKVLLHVGAANRDPTIFKNPEEFSPNRTEAQPLSFGIGNTKCIGHSLAFKEALEFLNVLSKKNISLEIRENEIEWDNGIAGRNYKLIPAKYNKI